MLCRCMSCGPICGFNEEFHHVHSPFGITPGGNSTQSHFKGHGSELEVIQSLAQLQVVEGDDQLHPELMQFQLFQDRTVLEVSSRKSISLLSKHLRTSSSQPPKR